MTNPASETPARVRRGFIDTAAGQVHYRTAAPAQPTGRLPLIMIHASPGSAQTLEPLIRRFSATREVIAPDTLGNGDSSPPPGVTDLADRPELSVFIEGHKQAIDALGIETFDLYGTHTGANIASELAIAWPGRVRHLILDGVSLFSDEERADMIVNYAPGVALADDGTHLAHVWNFVRDTFLFWPWYKRRRENLRGLPLPSTKALHEKALEVLKAVSTFHYSYNAAFIYRKEERLPKVAVPTLLACAKNDMLLPYLDQVAALMPTAKTMVTPGPAAPETIAAMTDFLDKDPV